MPGGEAFLGGCTNVRTDPDCFAFAGIGNSDRVVVDIGDPVEIPMATLTDMYINRQRDAKIQIQVVDTLGDVKRNKLVVIRPHKLGLEITGESMITDHEGRVSGVVVRSVSEGLPNVAVIQYQLTVACRRPSGLNLITEDYWRAVGNSNDGSSDLTRWQNGMSTTPYFQPYHENTYGKLRVRNTFPSASDQLHMPAGSFLLPALNGVLYGVHEKWLIGSDSGSPYVYGAQELRGVIDGYHVENYFYPLGSSNPYRVQNIDKLMQPFENAGFTTFSPVDQRDEFSYAALAYEFAFEVGKAVTPGADAFDLTVEYAWKPFVKDEPPNHIVGLLSAAGLLMDLGHLIPGAGTAASTAGNVVVGVLRFAIRHVDDWGPAGKAFLSGLVAIGGTAKQTIIVLFKYVEKIPGDPVEKVSMLLRTWDSLVRGAWQFSGDAVAKTVKKLSGRSVWYKKEAQIGLTRFMHAGKETFTDTVLEYGDEVAEKTFELLSFTDEAGSFLVDLAKFSDEAVEGLAKFLKNADSAVGDSGEIAAKLLRLDDVAKNDIFKKINTWVDDPAAGVSLAESCAGLKKLVNKAEIGPQEISEVFRQLGENSGQGYIGSAGKTLEYVRSGVPHPDTGLKMVQDSLSALKATPTNRLVDQQVLAELGGAIPSMKEFHALRNLDVGSLTTAQKAKLTDIRSMIPAPGPDEVLSKVVRFNQIDEFITRPDLPIGGFVTKQADVTDLSTATQLYDNLRLDYGDGPILNDGLGLVEFPRPLNVECGIPTKPNIDLDYPYSGNGFLSTKSARVQPEWVMSYEPFPLGSQLFQIDPFGNRVLRAVRVQDGWQIILPFTP